MSYEPGTYMKELKEEHQNGEHAENESIHCPVCQFQVVPKGFSSIEEFGEVLQKTADELQREIDAHARGEHQGKKVLGCIEC